jgi:hypothetical protein
MSGFFYVCLGYLTKRCLFFMALVALNWAFVFKFVARDAGFMGELFTPALNLSNFALVTIEALNMLIRLVFPMLEPEVHDPHLEVDDFRATVYGWFFILCCKGKGAGEDKGEGEGNYQGK